MLVVIFVISGITGVLRCLPVGDLPFVGHVCVLLGFLWLWRLCMPVLLLTSRLKSKGVLDTVGSMAVVGTGAQVISYISA
jgi:hypothetical protein